MRSLGGRGRAPIRRGVLPAGSPHCRGSVGHVIGGENNLVVILGKAGKLGL